MLDVHSWDVSFGSSTSRRCGVDGKLANDRDGVRDGGRDGGRDGIRDGVFVAAAFAAMAAAPAAFAFRRLPARRGTAARVDCPFDLFAAGVCASCHARACCTCARASL